MNQFGKLTSFVASIFLALVLSSCGSAGTPTPQGGFGGTWNDTVKNSYGIVRMQYKLVQQGDQLSGQVYASKNNELLRVGTLSGTLSSDGSAQIESVFNENGASGSSKLSGTFSGNGFSGTLRTYKSNGSPNETVSQKLVRISASPASASMAEGADLKLE